MSHLGYTNEDYLNELIIYEECDKLEARRVILLIRDILIN